MTAEDWETTCSLAIKLFKFGQELANEKDLILVDTKYEFGKDEEGNILLIDEVSDLNIAGKMSGCFRFILLIPVGSGSSQAMKNEDRKVKIQTISIKSSFVAGTPLNATLTRLKYCQILIYNLIDRFRPFQQFLKSF